MGRYGHVKLLIILMMSTKSKRLRLRASQAGSFVNWFLFGFLSTFLLSSLLLLLSLAHSFVHSSVLERLRHDLTLW